MSMQLTRPYRGPRMWTTDLFECCDDPTSCIEATFCPWCSVAAQHNRLTRNSIGVDSLCCLMLCLSDSCLTCGFLTVCANIKYRGEIQRRYGIMSDDCQNCLASMYCLPCAISQQYRELCYRSMYPGGLCVSPPVGTPMGFPPPMQSSPQLIIMQHVVAPAPPPPPPPTYAVVTVAPVATYGAYNSPQVMVQQQGVYGYPQPAPNQQQIQPTYYGQPLQPAPNQPQQYYGNDYYSPRTVDAATQPQQQQQQQPPYAQNQGGYAKEY